jgi:hypothetical protein
VQLSIQLSDDAQEPLGLILPGGCTLLHEKGPAYVEGEVSLVGSVKSHKGVAHAHVAGDQGDAVLLSHAFWQQDEIRILRARAQKRPQLLSAPYPLAFAEGAGTAVTRRPHLGHAIVCPWIVINDHTNPRRLPLL